MTYGSLFAGIGGIDLGLDRAGFTCRWQVENDPYCVEVLKKHWPHVPKYGDITTLDSATLEPVDLICGGFPCQPVSVAGRRKAQADSRWLWSEFARLIGSLRPRWVLVENVPGLRSANGGAAFAEVLQDLARHGYDAEWASIPAAAVGAPHLRYRVFLVAYRAELRRPLADRYSSGSYNKISAGRDAARNGGADVADAAIFSQRKPDQAYTVANERGARPLFGGGSWWAVEPGVGRVAHGVPARVDRLRALGNAVVPQVAEWVGRQILDAEVTSQGG